MTIFYCCLSCPGYIGMLQCTEQNKTLHKESLRPPWATGKEPGRFELWIPELCIFEKTCSPTQLLNQGLTWLSIQPQTTSPQWLAMIWQNIRKVDVTENLVAVAGPKVAVVSDKRGSEGLKGSGNPAWYHTFIGYKIVSFIDQTVHFFVTELGHNSIYD